MFRFTQTIIRELSACASLSYNVDFGYISLFEVIGIVAAHFVHSAMNRPSLIFRVKLSLGRSTLTPTHSMTSSARHVI